jgi:Cu+-exporting ATPase
MSNKTTLSVKGMTCASCAQGIDRHLTSKGVKGVHVFYDSGEVEFETIGEQQTNFVISEINKLGYNASSAYKEIQNEKSHSPLFIKTALSLIVTIPLWATMIFYANWMHSFLFQFVLSSIVLIIGLNHFGKSAIGSLRQLRPNMDVLIMMGAFTSFLYSIAGYSLAISHDEWMNYNFFETTASIITFVLIGNLIEEKSLKRTNTSIASLIKMQPSKARRITNAYSNNEGSVEVDIELLNPNDLILVNSGDKIPADGLIYEGYGQVDASALTGESIPESKSINDKVLAGTILVEGSIKCIVEKCGKDTSLSSMIDLVKKSSFKKPAIQKLSDKISLIFVPTVIGISIVTFLINCFVFDISTTNSMLRAIAVLVISCPCAMGLAIPTAVAVSIGNAAKKGILIKGGDVFDKIQKIEEIVFDKTGTLTTGKFKIETIHYTNEDALTPRILYSLEQYSSHPIAKSILAHLQDSELTNGLISFQDVQEIKGKGIFAKDKEGNEYYLGSGKFAPIATDSKYQVYLFKNKELLAYIELKDEIRSEAKEVIEWLKTQNIKSTILSGDTNNRCKSIALELGIDNYLAQQLPKDKADYIERQSKLHAVAMIGDGINDAAALSLANLSLAIGDGSSIAISSGEIILMTKNPLAGIKKIKTLSEFTNKIIRQNLFWAFIYNIIAIPFAATGLLHPMIASLSMGFSDVIVIGNSLRIKNK